MDTVDTFSPEHFSSSRPRILWIYYAEKPSGLLPRRWKGLAGYGRLDIAARLLLASLYPRGVLEEDTGSILFLHETLGNGVCILFTNNCLPYAMSYEHESARLILESLQGQACPLFNCNIFSLVKTLKNSYRVVLLSEHGAPVTEIDGDYMLFIIGTRSDPPQTLVELADKTVRIGCRSYLASTVAAYINLLLNLKKHTGNSRPIHQKSMVVDEG